MVFLSKDSTDWKEAGFEPPSLCLESTLLYPLSHSHPWSYMHVSVLHSSFFLHWQEWIWLKKSLPFLAGVMFCPRTQQEQRGREQDLNHQCLVYWTIGSTSWATVYIKLATTSSYWLCSHDTWQILKIAFAWLWPDNSCAPWWDNKRTFTGEAAEPPR